MKKENRLRKNMEFKKVYKSGKNYWNRNLIVYVRRNGTDKTRIGISITKKVGDAVVRNKLKRRIREVSRVYLPNLRKGYDLIFIPKKNAVDLSFAELESAIMHIYRISGITEKVN